MIVNNDCLFALAKLKPNTIDSLVTDPPAGISFMGKDWDGDKGDRDSWILWLRTIMKECRRVMKPGAHGLVWALPRTSHWTATALEDAGFEIRDVVTHLFGSGFPKSLDISKAIDRAAGVERTKVLSSYRTGEGAAFKYSGNGVEQLHEAKAKEIQRTEAETDEAKQYSGWGTALKPASEHWILVRKPCSEKTVAKNVLKWGTGGINIDACRVGYQSDEDLEKTKRGVQAMRDTMRDQKQSDGWDRPWQKDAPRSDNSNVKMEGRFPANLVLDETAAKMLDEQSGERPAGYRENPSTQSGSKFQSNLGAGERGYKDTGGASRFFYVAKASRRERNAGLEVLKTATKHGARPCDWENQDWSKVNSNHHPTVKPLKLMQYLITLITPPKGVVLDPFMGSGSTGVAAKKLGFKFIGVEKEKEYFEIAEARLDASQRI